MRTATIEDVTSLGPCPDSDPDPIERLFYYGRTRVTGLDVLETRSIPLMDRYWILLRGDLFLTREQVQRFKLDCAQSAVIRLNSNSECRQLSGVISAARRVLPEALYDFAGSVDATKSWTSRAVSEALDPSSTFAAPLCALMAAWRRCPTASYNSATRHERTRQRLMLLSYLRANS